MFWFNILAALKHLWNSFPENVREEVLGACVGSLLTAGIFFAAFRGDAASRAAELADATASARGDSVSVVADSAALKPLVAARDSAAGQVDAATTIYVHDTVNVHDTVSVERKIKECDAVVSSCSILRARDSVASAEKDRIIRDLTSENAHLRVSLANATSGAPKHPVGALPFALAVGSAAAVGGYLDHDPGGYPDNRWDLTKHGFHASTAAGLSFAGQVAGVSPLWSAVSVCGAQYVFERAQGYASPRDVIAGCAGSFAAYLWNRRFR